MAMTREERSARSFRPRWPSLDTIDPSRAAMNYWSDIDTLMIDFSGQARPAVSVPLDVGGDRDFVFLRVDPSTEEVVGLQIEDVVAHAVRERPALRHALGEAETHGTTAKDVLAVLAQSHGGPEGRREIIKRLIEEFRSNSRGT
jgi:hypothetical protein